MRIDMTTGSGGEVMMYAWKVSRLRHLLFEDQYQGDTTIHKFKERDELLAWASLLSYEAEIAFDITPEAMRNYVTVAAARNLDLVFERFPAVP